MNMMIKKVTVLLFSSFLLVDASSASAQDTYADSVVSYIPGMGISSYYTNASAALGAPDPTASIIAPAYGTTNIVGVGVGGELTVAFSVPITNNAVAHADGMDFTIFGNEFFILSESTISGIYDHAGLTVWVSQDDENFYQLIAPESLSYGVDELYPTDGRGNACLPISPLLSLTNFTGDTAAQALSLYDGSAGGTSYSISWAENTNGSPEDLLSVSYVKVEGGTNYGYVDAISRVENVPEPSELALLFIGVGIMLCYRKRRLHVCRNFPQ
jgi:hypothetical protein